jgi:AraC family ethanolamine operon transcriptional activator
MDVPPAISIKSIRFTDFEAVRDALPSTSTEVIQVDRGPMSGHITRVSLGKSIDLTSGSFSCGLISRGVASLTRPMIAMAQSTGKIVGKRVREVRPNDLWIAPPSLDRQLRYFGASHFVGVLFDPREVGETVADLHYWRHSTPSAFNVRETMLHDLDTIVHQIAQHPDLSADAADFYRRAILEMIGQSLQARTVHHDLVRSWSLMHDITDYLRAIKARPVHISELCERFSVSRRTLHRVFEERIGMSPIAYLRHRRLCEVHSVLLSGNVTSIAETAVNHGFVQLSRFAAAYRALFGELPSHTLQRSASFRINSYT